MDPNKEKSASSISESSQTAKSYARWTAEQETFLYDLASKIWFSNNFRINVNLINLSIKEQKLTSLRAKYQMQIITRKKAMHGL